MMIVLSSCSSTCPKVEIPILETIKKVEFKQGELNCLGKPLKIIVVDRIKNCENRLDTLNNQIKALNK